MDGEQSLQVVAAAIFGVGAVTLYLGWIETGNREHCAAAKFLTLAGVGLLSLSVPLWMSLAE